LIATFASMTDKQAKGSGRGGKRDGSGRRKSYIDPVRIKVTLEGEDVKAIEKKGHNVPAFVREAALKRLKEDW